MLTVVFFYKVILYWGYFITEEIGYEDRFRDGVCLIEGPLIVEEIL